MVRFRLGRTCWPYLAAFSIALADQAIKFAARRLFVEEAVLIPGFLSLKLVMNAGAGFGILQGHRAALIAFSAIVIAAAFYYLAYHARTGDSITRASLALITGGALGNLLDRAFFGYVTDFIGFSFWPAFNFADMCITAGALLLAWRLVRS